MKYIVLIIDGAAGTPLPGRGNKTCLELAGLPNLDSMAESGTVGMARTIPEGIEASSANACMSVLGYNPLIHRPGRAAIEARSMGIPVEEGEVLFRANLVSVGGGLMKDYSAGRISTPEARQLIEALNNCLGTEDIIFYPGLNYRHILKLKNHPGTLEAVCTPPHDISGQPIDAFVPRGEGSDLLLELMSQSVEILEEHPVNAERTKRKEPPANMLWLFWGSPKETWIPAFSDVYGITPAVTSAVDVINGLAAMMGMDVLDLPGITDGMDNDFAGQAEGALAALDRYDMAVIHVEAPDEAGHAGDADEKIESLEIIDREIVGRIKDWNKDSLRVLVMPDHPTPIDIRTHSPEPVPFLLWGAGTASNGAHAYNEKTAAATGLLVDPGYYIMGRLLNKI